MLLGHSEEVLRIYQRGIDTGHATFLDIAPTWKEFDADHLAVGRLVALDGDQVVGWAALTAASGRCVYSGVAEVSLYVDPASQGKGVGTMLLSALVQESEAAGIWTLQAGIFPENLASLDVHERAGFRRVGTRERLGKMAFGPLKGQWRDVVWLERRSQLDVYG